MGELIIENVRIVAPDKETASEPVDIAIVGNQIAEIGTSLGAKDGKRIQCGGRFLLPGLIDCHVHPFLADANLARRSDAPTLMSARAGRIP